MHTKKYFALFIGLFFITCSAIAQSGDYMVHAIQQGETLSALAKQYNTTVGDIMRMNSMNSKSQLKIGQQIKIPVKTNAAPAIVVAAEPTVAVVEKPVVVATPVDTIKYIVAAKESLFGIAKKYHVYVAQIKQWNKLKDDNIKAGQTLLVIAPQKQITQPTQKIMPAKPSIDTTKKEIVAANMHPEGNTATPTKEQPVKITPAKPTVDTTVKEKIINAPKEGYFKNEYVKGNQEAMGTAATFKSASGWADKKYYVLMNKVDAGTIVRVASNNKIIYAKVLGALPDIKDDAGLLLRLSNAAASTLGIADSKFEVIVNY